MPSLTCPLCGVSSPSSNRNSVLLPQPFGPMMPIRSPRRIVIVRSRTSAVFAEAEADVLEIGDDLAGPSAAVEIEVHRALQRYALTPLHPQRFEPSHATFVAGAARFDAFSDPHLFFGEELVEIRVLARFDLEHLLLANEVLVVVAGKRHEPAAVEFDDARGEAPDQRAVVRDEYRGALIRQQHFFERGDRVDVHVVGRLVQQQHVRVGDQRARQHHATTRAARAGADDYVGGQGQTG